MTTLTNNFSFTPELASPTIFEPDEAAKRPVYIRATEEQFRNYRVPAIGPDSWRPLPSHTAFDFLSKELADKGFRHSDPAFILCRTRKNPKIGDQGTHDRHMIQMTIDHPNLATVDGYSWNISLLNSYDMSWACRFEGGSEYDRCANGLSWGIEESSSRKHTKGINENYDDAFEVIRKHIARSVEGIIPSFEKQVRALDWQRQTECTDDDARFVTVEAVKQKVVNAARIMKVLEHWWSPEHPEFKERTVWSLMQAFTSSDRGRNMSDRGSRFHRLESIIDRRFGRSVSEEMPLYDTADF
jgi:hypothetical protein